MDSPTTAILVGATPGCRVRKVTAAVVSASVPAQVHPVAAAAPVASGVQEQHAVAHLQHQDGDRQQREAPPPVEESP
jgi:hypothetical protein